MTFQKVVLEAQEQDVLMNVGPFDWEKLVAIGEPFVDINRYGRVGKGETPVNADPGLMNHWSDQVVAFWVGGAGDFSYEVNGCFLDK
jgi:hypothetical protein